MTYINNQYLKLDIPLEEIAKIKINTYYNNNFNNKLIDPVLKGPDWNPSDSGKFRNN